MLLLLITDQQQRTFSSAEKNEKSTTRFARAREHHRIFQRPFAPSGAEMTRVGLIDVGASIPVRIGFFRARLAYFQTLAIFSSALTENVRDRRIRTCNWFIKTVQLCSF